MMDKKRRDEAQRDFAQYLQNGLFKTLKFPTFMPVQ